VGDPLIEGGMTMAQYQITVDSEIYTIIRTQYCTGRH